MSMFRKKQYGGFLSGGAKDSEFLLPSDIVKHAHIVGFNEEQAREIKDRAKPLPDMVEGSSELDGWGII